MGWLTSGFRTVVGAVTGIDIRVVAGLIGAVALLGSYVGVYYVGKANGRTVEVRTQLQTETRWRDRAATETRQIATRNVAREINVQNHTRSIQGTSEQIHTALDRTPNDYGNVRISIGDVCLLNQARRHWTDTSPPDPACRAVSAFETSSTVSVRDLIRADVDAATQYNELAVVHDQSVEFLRTELLGQSSTNRRVALGAGRTEQLDRSVRYRPDTIFPRSGQSSAALQQSSERYQMYSDHSPYELQSRERYQVRLEGGPEIGRSGGGPSQSDLVPSG